MIRNIVNGYFFNKYVTIDNNTFKFVDTEMLNSVQIVNATHNFNLSIIEKLKTKYLNDFTDGYVDTIYNNNIDEYQAISFE